jgi:ribosomal-protein-alanine N-acetyltransferase
VVVRYSVGESSVADVVSHLTLCDAGFVPPLSLRTDLRDYAERLVDRSTRFEAWHDDELVGLVAAYLDGAADRSAFITSVSVVPAWGRRGIASRLLERAVDRARGLGLARVRLEVGEGSGALALYRLAGFAATTTTSPTVTMELTLDSKDDHGN